MRPMYFGLFCQPKTDGKNGLFRSRADFVRLCGFKYFYFFWKDCEGKAMPDYIPDKKVPEKPVENQKTAAWSNIDEISEDAHTAQPSLEQVVNAKDYVDENEK